MLTTGGSPCASVVFGYSCSSVFRRSLKPHWESKTNPSHRILSAATGSVASARTGSNGNYSFAGVESGLYSLSISSQGFRTSQFSQRSLRPGFNSNINATLNVGSTAGTIEVSSLNTIQNGILTSALRRCRKNCRRNFMGRRRGERNV
jgi:hypothetical protein